MSVEEEILTTEELIEKYDLEEEEFRMNNNDVESEEESISIDTYERKIKKKSSLNKNDVGYNKFYIQKKNLKIKVEVFSTNSNVGSLIRCPFTGIRTNDRVGSRDEDYYYKVKCPAISKGDVPVVLYYTTPESFERHFMCNLGEKVKENWRNRRKQFIDNMEEEGDIEIR